MDNTQNMTSPAQANSSTQSSDSFVIRNVRTQEALARFAGDKERYRHWLNEFITHGPAATTQIRQAITNGTPDMAINLAHALKGRTGMLGMIELHSIAQSLEMALRNNEPADLWLEELELTTEEMSKEIASVLINNTP